MAATQHTDPTEPRHPDQGRPTLRLRRPVGPQPRLDLVAHLRDLISRDPEGYASMRLPYVVDRIAQDVTGEEPDRGGR